MWIKVETQIEAQKLAFEIESSGLYQLYGLQHIIELQDKICNIYILKDIRLLTKPISSARRALYFCKNREEA